MSEGTGKMIVLDTRYCEELCLVVELVGMEMSWLVWRLEMHRLQNSWPIPISGF